MFSFNSFRTYIFILTMILIITTSSTVYASEQATKINVYYAPIHFVFDGKEYSPPQDQRGFIYKDRTYVPLRFITYSLNKAIQWDGDTFTVTVHDPSREDSILISEYNLNTLVRDGQINKVGKTKMNPSSIQVYFKKVTYIFDGEEKTPPEETPGLIYNSRIYVPMRFFSESLNKQIDWDEETLTISANSEAYEAHLNEKKTEEEITTNDSQIPITPTPSTGGSGSNEQVKPSYESIKAEADAKILSLRSRAESYYINLLLEYQSTDSAARMEELKTQGINKLGQFDNEFAGIIHSLRTNLSSHGYSTDIADEYEQEYENQKAIAKGLIGL